MINVAFGSVPKDGGTFTFYRTLRPALVSHGINLRCVTVGCTQSELTDPAFVDDGCVLLASHSKQLKTQARIFADWCENERIDIVFGVNSPAILSAIPHLHPRIRVLARCANGFDEGYRLTLIGSEQLMRIVALTPRLRDDLVNQYGVDPARIALIPNGATPARFTERTGPSQKADKLSLGFLGRLEHGQKGVMHIPPILDRLERLGIEYHLSIAGKGRDENRLRHMLARQIAAGQIDFAGILGPKEVPDFLGAIDVFLFPSHFEGCPNALLEAMMAGAVPVAWHLPGITDFLLRNGETGCLAETGDTEAFAAAIAGLGRDPVRRQAMSQAVASDARRRFSSAICAQAYGDLFNKIMEEAAPDWTPLPWSRFEPDPMFREKLLTRLLPARQKKTLRNLATRLRRKSVKSASVNCPVRGANGLRIHQIINGFDVADGGAQRMARELHRGLRAQGIDAHLVALETCADHGEGEVSLGLSSSYDPRGLTRLSHYAKQIAPGDIIHVHLFPASAHVATLARGGRLHGPLVFTEHSTSNRRRESLVGSLVDRQVYPAFDRIIAISTGVQDRLLQARPWLTGDVTVIENGCRLLFDRPVRHKAGPGPLRLLSVGRLVPAKNFEAALKALARLADQNIHYTIVGDGPERAALEDLATRLGVQVRVEFAGYVSDIRDHLRKADIFLMPSNWEGFGLAAVEAMNASLPIIAADVPGLRDVLNLDAATLVDPQDPDDIAAAIRHLTNDPARCRAMGQHGFERAKSFGMQTFIQRHVELYQSFSDRHSHGT
ncbi:glycosyltransferase family 4 protein [Pontibaca salina]|uniref:Glycosyltransferase family 4 protein n=1 Tax=Pontibaca salina TaxID=2795731 RepID=A0A934M3V7_9RHOB|nr:glycosyltransferase family 4 protein [Pontibaca salina]MBI6630254.1 glycosyltransferase family 4 protein [Pontibaca salina]